MSRFRQLLASIAGALVLTSVLSTSAVTASSAGAATTNGSAVQYKQTLDVTPTLAAPISANIGADGDYLFFTPTTVFGLDHVGSMLLCIDKATGANCNGFPRTLGTELSDGPGKSVVSSHVYVDYATKKFYLFYIDTGTPNAAKAGVATFTYGTNSATFVSKQTLFNFGRTNSPPSIGHPIYVVDGKIFDLALGEMSPTATPNNVELLCFNVVTSADCSTSLYLPNYIEMPTYVQHASFSVASDVTANPSEFSVALTMGYSDPANNQWTNVKSRGCVDFVTLASCGAKVLTKLVMSGTGPSKYSPVLDAHGKLVGSCTASSGVWSCVDNAGASMSAPAGWTDKLSGWSWITIGSRAFALNVDYSQLRGNPITETPAEITCVNFVSQAACPGFPVAIHNAFAEYTLNVDPSAPSCFWMMADRGTGADGVGQVQNFDAYTGQSCGGVGVPSARVLLSQFVSSPAACTPTKWGVLHVESAASYTSSKVTFVDANGAPITSIPDQHFDASGNINMATLGLPISDPLPQAIVSLDTGSATPFTLTMTWDGSYDPTCITEGQTTTVLAHVVDPTIASVQSNQGSTLGGETVTINGTGFVVGASVTIDGNPCTNLVVVSATQITCTTPPGSVGPVVLRVVNPDLGTADSTFTYIDTTPSPTVTAIDVNSDLVIGGTTVTITGTGFQSGAIVTIGGQACTNVVVVSATQITCTDPALGTGRYDVVVVNPDNRSGSLSEGMSYHELGALPAPTLTKVLPFSDRTTGGKTLTLTGTGFQAGAVVTIGGHACTNVVVVSATQITCTDPSMQPGSYDVVVTNPDSQFGNIQNGFSYLLPTITAVAASSGPKEGGNKVTISGTGFIAGDDFFVGGLICKSLVVVSPTKATCTVPAMASGQTPGPVDVTLNDPSLDPSNLPTLRGAYTYLDTTSTTLTSAPVEQLSLEVHGKGTLSARIAGAVANRSVGYYPRGTKETLIARPAAGTIAVWGGVCAGAKGNTCIVNVNAAKFASVYFTPAATATLPTFFFDVDKFNVVVSAAQQATIVRDLRILSTNGITRFTVTGYADVTSTTTHNYWLGIHRAQAVSQYLQTLAAHHGLKGLTFVQVPVGQTKSFGSLYYLNRRATVTG